MATLDLASLGIRVHSEGVSQANSALDSFVRSSQQSAQAADRLSQSAARLENSMGGLSSVIRQMDELIRGLDLDRQRRAAEEAERAARAAAENADRVRRANRAATESTNQLDEAMNKLLKTAVKIYASFKVFELSKGAVMDAARFQTLGVVMETAGRNAGYTAKQMKELEVSLQKQGISMEQSRENLARMAAAHIDLAKASQIARAAQDVAVVGNVNSSEAFTRLTRGIQSGEQEILKTIGLNVQWEAGYKTLAKELNKTADALTNEEKILARTNTVLQAAAGYAGIYEAAMSTAGKQLGSLSRYFSDISTNIGTVALESFSGFLGEFSNFIKGVDSDLKKMAESGELIAWGHKIAETFKFIAGGIDNVLVALALLAVAIKIQTALSTQWAVTQIATIRLIWATAGATTSLTGGLLVLRSVLISIATSPVFWVVAFGTALYTLWDNMKQGEAETQRLKDAFYDLGEAGEKATQTAKDFAGVTAQVMLAKAKDEVANDIQALEDARKRLEDARQGNKGIESKAGFQKGTEFQLASGQEKITGIEDFTKQSARILDDFRKREAAAESYAAKAEEAEKAMKKLAAVEAVFGKQDSISKARDIIAELGGAAKKAAASAEHLKDVNEQLKKIEENAAKGKDAFEHLRLTMADMETTKEKQAATAKDAITQLQKFTQGTLSAKNEQFAADQQAMAFNLTLLATAGILATLSIDFSKAGTDAVGFANDVAHAASILDLYGKFSKRVGEVKPPKEKGGGSGGAKRAAEIEDKVKQLEIRLMETQAELGGASKEELAVFKIRVEQQKELADLQKDMIEAGKSAGSAEYKRAEELLTEIYRIKLGVAEYTAEWSKTLKPLRDAAEIAETLGVATAATTQNIKEQERIMIEKNPYLEREEKARQIAKIEAEIFMAAKDSAQAYHEAAAAIAERNGNLQEAYKHQSQSLQLDIEQAERALALVKTQEQRVQVEATILDLKQQQAEADVYANQNVFGAFDMGLKEKAYQAQEDFVELYRTDLPDAIGDTASAFSDLSYDLIFSARESTAVWEDFGKALSDIFNNLAKKLLDATIQAILFGDAVKGIGGVTGQGGDKGGGILGFLSKGVGGLLGGLMGGGGGANLAFSAGGGNWWDPGFGSVGIGWGMHGGGTVGSQSTFQSRISMDAFANARRYHGGGRILGHDEVPIIGKKNEHMSTESEWREIQASKGGGSVDQSYNPTYNINVNVEGGSSGDSSMDEEYAKKIAGSITQQIDARIDNRLVTQMRPGGILNGGISG